MSARVITGVDKAALRSAVKLYERFSGMAADEVLRVPVQRTPKYGVAIGLVDGLLYSAIREGELEHYEHIFEEHARPLFAVSPDGRRLFLLGGSFSFTDRGIVDR